jgi:hypothetical protein
MVVTASDAADDSIPLSEYELLRQSKIARNEARLASLGLTGITGSKRARSAPSVPSVPRRKVTKAPIDPSLLRRSGRVVNVAPNYTEDAAYKLLDSAERRMKTGGARGESSEPDDVVRKEVPVDVDGEKPPPLSGALGGGGGKVMAKDLHIDCELVVAAMLNKSMGETGKAVVVDYLASSSSTLHSEVGFSKYSGVLEFANAAVLWVNFDAVSSHEKYSNTFLAGGEKFTWFGSVSKMNMAAEGGRRLVARLLKLGKEGKNVLLFTRFCDGSKAGPYACLGRVKHAEHDEDSSPMRWVWSLVDYKELKEGPKEGPKGGAADDRNLFQEFVDF